MDVYEVRRRVFPSIFTRKYVVVASHNRRKAHLIETYFVLVFIAPLNFFLFLSISHGLHFWFGHVQSCLLLFM